IKRMSSGALDCSAMCPDRRLAATERALLGPVAGRTGALFVVAALCGWLGLDWLGQRRPRLIEALGQRYRLELDARQALDLLQICALFAVDKGDRDAALTGAR